MIDRTVLGYVVDMIDFRLIDFAVFNGADSFICVGAGLMVFFLVRDIIREGKAKSAPVVTDESAPVVTDESAPVVSDESAPESEGEAE